MGKSRQGSGRECNRTWGTCFYSSVDGVLWASYTKATDLFKSKRAGFGDFGKLCGGGGVSDLRGRLWGRGLLQGSLRESFQEILFTCDSAGCY